MPGAEGCPRIPGPAPNHRSWRRVQSLQAHTSLSQPDVLRPAWNFPSLLASGSSLGVRTEEEQRTLLCCQPPLLVLSAGCPALHSHQGLDEPVLLVCSRAGAIPCGPVISPKFGLITPSAHDNTQRGSSGVITRGGVSPANEENASLWLRSMGGNLIRGSLYVTHHESLPTKSLAAFTSLMREREGWVCID